MTSASDFPVLLWFRDDLRLEDHAALHAAVETGRPVLAVFILDDQAAGPWALGGASRWWLHHSLAALQDALNERGSPLCLRRGDSVAIIAEISQQTGATEVFTGGSADPHARRLDKAASEAIDGQLHRMRTTTLFHPDAVRTKTGGAYSVYTPFANACRALGDPRPPLPAPKAIRAAKASRSDRLEEWDLLPTKPDWAGGLRDVWTPAKRERWRGQRRSWPTVWRVMPRHGTSQGARGPRCCRPYALWRDLAQLPLAHGAPTAKKPGSRGLYPGAAVAGVCANQLWHNPGLPDTPLRPEFAGMPWRDDKAGLRAWQKGQTGVPMVDAGMRQLWQAGWMHNRVRMIVASFLIKHLMIPWQEGEAWFWDTLVDADLASNAANWQWVAGCGADAAPYFRIFNPVLQGRKFDTAGDYVRRFVPEIAGLDARYIHAPWEAPPDTLAKAGVTLGETYPHPIVDLGEGRARALDAFARIRTPA